MLITESFLKKQQKILYKLSKK